MRRALSLGASFSLVLAGCVSVGTNYDPNRVGLLQPGMTQAQVVALLGRPNGVATNANGQQVLVWMHSTGSMFGASARSLTLVFGPDGLLQQAPTMATQVSY